MFLVYRSRYYSVVHSAEIITLIISAPNTYSALVQKGLIGLDYRRGKGPVQGPMWQISVYASVSHASSTSVRDNFTTHLTSYNHMSTYKRKRNPQDSNIDFSTMAKRLDTLKRELDDMEYAEDDMLARSEHVLEELEDILRGAKKPVCCILLAFCASVIDDAPETNILYRYN